MWVAMVISLEAMMGMSLPQGPAPEPVATPHFPSRLHAFVWRNWELVPLDVMAATVDAEPDQIRALGAAMGLPDPPEISADQRRRSYMTVIRRNWHLLPYDQLQELLGWTEEELAYTLQEDDFLWHKLGRLKPNAARLVYSAPDAAAQARAGEIAKVVARHFPEGLGAAEEPLFAFVDALSRLPEETPVAAADDAGGLSPRYCYSYFATYGDPLLNPDPDPYPEGLLARLAATGVDGVWLQGVLYRLAPNPWAPELSAGWERRLENLNALIARARRHGIGLYLYLNEPRSMPLSFFEGRPELQGVPNLSDGEHVTRAALCTSAPEVQAYLRDAVAHICRHAPELAGIFTISASENLTNCWSHGRGDLCPRCAKRSPQEVIAEANALIQEGIDAANADVELLVWDWGWANDWAEGIIERLPAKAALVSVSEWDLPIQRGGVDAAVGEYSISSVGPGPRARRHWAWARARGMRTIAKVQAGNTWELSTVPYIPALANVAQHAANLRRSNIDGVMLGWTLGGYPSPNLEAFALAARPDGPEPDEALRMTAARRFGVAAAAPTVAYWKAFSRAFSEFPYHIGTVYAAPVQTGPANLVWETSTGYGATMVCFPYDHLDGWRSVYPADVFTEQLTKASAGMGDAVAAFREAVAGLAVTPEQRRALERELDVGEAAAIIYTSAVDQCRFIMARDALAGAAAEERDEIASTLRTLLEREITLAKRLYAIQRRDARIGFEATNHYFFVPTDLAEKVLNCEDLLTRWLPGARETE